LFDNLLIGQLGVCHRRGEIGTLELDPVAQETGQHTGRRRLRGLAEQDEQRQRHAGDEWKYHRPAFHIASFF